MPRPRKQTERWSHPLYRVGFCLNRKGTVYTEIQGVRFSTGLVWHEKNKREALGILERRVLEYLNPPKEQEKVQERMISEAVREYAPVVQQYSVSTQHQYKRAFVRLLPHDCALTDTEEIRRMITQGLEEYDAAANTKRQLVKRLHTFFEFCLRRAWVSLNPAKQVVVPKLQKTDVFPFTRDELKRMVAYNREAENIEFSLLLEFLGQTAMRIGETLKLPWSSVDERKIIVDGKGGIEREIPIMPFPMLREVLNELRARNDAERHSPKVFRWSTLPVCQRQMKATCEALGIVPRGFHAIRKMRENEWIDEEGVPPHVAALLAGHSVAVQEASYRKKPKAAELEKLLSSWCPKRDTNLIHWNNFRQDFLRDVLWLEGCKSPVGRTKTYTKAASGLKRLFCCPRNLLLEEYGRKSALTLCGGLPSALLIL